MKSFFFVLLLTATGSIIPQTPERVQFDWSRRVWRTNVVVDIIKERINPDEFDQNGYTLIGWAAYNGRTVLVRHLLERGVLPDVPSEGGLTPLMLAAMEGHLDAFSLLLGAGADIRVRDDQDNTALIWTARSLNIYGLVIEDETAIVELLIESGAEVDARNAYGRSALLYTCMSNAPRILEALIRAGAETERPDEFGYTPVLAAEDSENFNMLGILQTAQASR